MSGQHQHADTGIRFVSLGMVVLDELCLPSGKVLHDCIGGSGAYSTLGARIVTPSVQAQTVGAFIVAGHDFPPDIEATLRRCGISVTLEVDPENRPSTRGCLEYHDVEFGRKTFRYTTTPLQPLPAHLSRHPDLLVSRAFHILRAPDALQGDVSELLRLRSQTQVITAAPVPEKPLIVWEPLPGLCKPENLDAHQLACRYVHVFSPNHLELLRLFGRQQDGDGEFDRRAVEDCAFDVLERSGGEGHLGAVVVRAGEHGCLVSSSGSRITNRNPNKKKTWLPPFFNVDAANRVVDATGGGNMFLGGFTMALAQEQRQQDDCYDYNHKILVHAAVLGTVAASFAIEQIGLPRITAADVGGQDDEEAQGEQWNGESFASRLKEYRGRLISS